MAWKNIKPLKLIAKYRLVAVFMLLSLLLAAITGKKVFGGLAFFGAGLIFDIDGYFALKTGKLSIPIVPIGAVYDQVTDTEKIDKSNKSDKFGVYFYILIGLILNLIGLIGIFVYI